MSEVMRFNMFPAGQPNPAANGLYVRHEDYARLEQECETLKQDYKEAAADAIEAAHKMRDAETERDAAIKQANGLRDLLLEISKSERRGVDWAAEIDSALAKP